MDITKSAFSTMYNFYYPLEQEKAVQEAPEEILQLLSLFAQQWFMMMGFKYRLTKSDLLILGKTKYPLSYIKQLLLQTSDFYKEELNWGNVLEGAKPNLSWFFIPKRFARLKEYCASLRIGIIEPDEERQEPKTSKGISIMANIR